MDQQHIHMQQNPGQPEGQMVPPSFGPPGTQGWSNEMFMGKSNHQEFNRTIYAFYKSVRSL